MKISDEIICFCKSGERAAQKQLYRLVLPYLNVVCKRYLSDHSYLNDVLQEVFILLFTRINTFDSTKASFKTWSVRVAVNCCLKQNKNNNRIPLQEFILTKHEPMILPRVLDQYSDEEILRFLKRMPEPFFQVFNLYEVDGFSHKEIGEILGINETLSRKRLSRAKEWLSKRAGDFEFKRFNLGT